MTNVFVATRGGVSLTDLEPVRPGDEGSLRLSNTHY